MSEQSWNLGELCYFHFCFQVCLFICSFVHSFIQPVTLRTWHVTGTVLVIGILHQNTMTLHSFPTKAEESVKNNNEGN